VKIHIAVEAEECIYWDYNNHKPSHTCGSCECLWEGNNIDNAKMGVMINGDRYCTMGCPIYAEIIKSLEDKKR
jgi:hypothetical protein